MARQMLSKLQDIYYGRGESHPWARDIQTSGTLHLQQTKPDTDSVSSSSLL